MWPPFFVTPPQVLHPILPPLLLRSAPPPTYLFPPHPASIPLPRGIKFLQDLQD